MLDKSHDLARDLSTYHYSLYVIQALLGTDTKRLEWCDVAVTSIPNWKRWKDHPNRIKFLSGHFWTDMFVFVNKATPLYMISQPGAKHRLRVIHRVVFHHEELVQ